MGFSVDSFSNLLLRNSGGRLPESMPGFVAENVAFIFVSMVSTQGKYVFFVLTDMEQSESSLNGEKCFVYHSC